MNPAEDSKPDSQNMDIENKKNHGDAVELENSVKEPPMYKKVKLSEVEGKKNQSEKNDNDRENGKVSKDTVGKHKKDGSKKNKDHKESRTNEKSEDQDKRDRKKSREASSSKKSRHEGSESHQRCSKCKKGKGNMATCSSCSRSYHLDCLTPKLEEAPKGSWNCERCGTKGKSDSKKKKKSKKDKSEKIQTQLKVENLGGSNKKSTKAPKKYKDETEKKFQEFARK